MPLCTGFSLEVWRKTNMKKGIDYIGVGIGAVIVDTDGKMLLSKRGPKAKNERGKWEFPGGGVEFGDTMEETIKREMKEELGIKTYDDFVKLATPYDYFIKSRMTRQVVFGDLNPKRQQNIQKRIINEFSQLLTKNGLSLFSSSSDEIIIDPKGNNDITSALVADIPKDVTTEKKFFRVEEFSFSKVHPAEDVHYYFKTSVDTTGKVKEEFKNVPSLYFPQVFKHQFKMDLEPRDMLFIMEGKLAYFLEPALPKVKNTVNLKFK